MKPLQILCLFGRTLAASPSTRGELADAWRQAGSDWTQLLQVATQHRIAPVLYTAVSRAGVADALPADFRAALSALRMFNRERNDRICAQAREITQTLNAEGITPLYFKGVAHLLTRLHAHPGDRMVGDMDLYVGEQDMLGAVAALQARGYRNEDPKFFYDTGQPRVTLHYPPLIRDDMPTTVEVHRAFLPAPLNDLYATARSRELAREDGENRYTILSHADAFAHSVFHAEVKHYHSRLAMTHLGMLFDSLRLASLATEPELEEMLERLRAGRCEHFALRHAGLMVEFFGAEAVPAPLCRPMPRRERGRLQRQLNGGWVGKIERAANTLLLIVRDDYREGQKQLGDAPLRRSLFKRLFQPGLYRNRLQKFSRFFSTEP